MNTAHMNDGKILFDCIGAAAVLGFSAIGWLIARRLPGNAIGWLLCVTGVLLAGSLATEQYALYGLATAPGSLPAVRQIGSLSGLLMILAAIQLVFLVLVFPDGHLPSRRWRPVLWGAYLTLAGAVLQGLQQGRIDGGLTNALVGRRASPTPIRPATSPSTAGSATSSPSMRGDCRRHDLPDDHLGVLAAPRRWS